MMVEFFKYKEGKQCQDCRGYKGTANIAGVEYVICTRDKMQGVSCNLCQDNCMGYDPYGSPSPREDLCSPHRLWCIIDTVRNTMVKGSFLDDNIIRYPSRNEIFDEIADIHCDSEEILEYKVGKI